MTFPACQQTHSIVRSTACPPFFTPAIRITRVRAIITTHVLRKSPCGRRHPPSRLHTHPTQGAHYNDSMAAHNVSTNYLQIVASVHANANGRDVRRHKSFDWQSSPRNAPTPITLLKCILCNVLSVYLSYQCGRAGAEHSAVAEINSVLLDGAFVMCTGLHVCGLRVCLCVYNSVPC